MRRALGSGIALVIALIASGCGEQDGGVAAPSISTTIETTTTASPSSTSPPPAPAPTQSAAAARPAATMPLIPCGTDLQLAQDQVQEAGVYYSRSEDATGAGRSQVVDRNWTVVRSTPAPGTPIDEGDPVFFAVKDEEFRGC